jgi:hypothetical protein
MILFSRSFVRKRVISLATTAAVAATSLALAHRPLRARDSRVTIPVQYIATRPDVSSDALLMSEHDSAMRAALGELTAASVSQSRPDGRPASLR